MKYEARHQLGERIRAMRKEQKLTLRGFGLMVGLSKDYLVDLEHGRKSPSLDTIVKIAGGFNITPSELLRGIGDPHDDNPPDGSGSPTPPYYHSPL